MILSELDIPTPVATQFCDVIMRCIRIQFLYGEKVVFLSPHVLYVRDGRTYVGGMMLLSPGEAWHNFEVTQISQLKIEQRMFKPSELQELASVDTVLCSV
jgi:hypothetical protein